MDLAERNQLLEQYLPLVNSCAKRIKKTIPRKFELDDLIQTGTIGLLKAIEDYNPGRGIALEPYAWFRVHNWIMDSVRSQYKHAELYEIPEDLQTSGPSLDDLIHAHQVLDKLPQRERQVVIDRFWGNEKPKVIAMKLGVKGSMARRIHRGAVEQLRAA